MLTSARTLFAALEPIVVPLKTKGKFTDLKKFEVSPNGKELHFQASATEEIIDSFDLWFKVNAYLQATAAGAAVVMDRGGRSLAVKITFP